jgi:hypothetical protein
MGVASWKWVARYARNRDQLKIDNAAKLNKENPLPWLVAGFFMS